MYFFLCATCVFTDLCHVVLIGDTASHTSLPGGDDDSLVDDSTSSRWGAECNLVVSVY